MAAEPPAWRHDWTVVPGEILAEALEERSMTQTELARRMDRPVKTINEIINGKAAITPETAIQLELTLGVPASVWNNLEASHRAHLARERVDQELATHADWAAAFPIKDMIKHDLISARDTAAGQVAEVLSYFQISTPEAWEKHWTVAAPSYRRSEAFEASPYASAAWLRWGEVVASDISTQPFDADRFRSVLAQIRDMTRRDFALISDRIINLCASAGVALVITPELRGTHVSGAARWLSPNKAIIQLSLRHKTDDQFWFSFFHEAGHLLDRTKADHLDGDPSQDQAGEIAGDEARANQFARDILITPDHYEQFLASQMLSEQAIQQFARDIKIAPGILLGRLQRDGHVARNRFNALKKPIRPAG